MGTEQNSEMVIEEIGGRHGIHVGAKTGNISFGW